MTVTSYWNELRVKPLSVVECYPTTKELHKVVYNRVALWYNVFCEW